MKVCVDKPTAVYLGHQTTTLKPRDAINIRGCERPDKEVTMQHSTSDIPFLQPSKTTDRRSRALAEIKAALNIEDMPDDLLEFLINAMYSVIVLHNLDFTPQSWGFAWQFLKDTGVITIGGSS